MTLDAATQETYLPQRTWDVWNRDFTAKVSTIEELRNCRIFGSSPASDRQLLLFLGQPLADAMPAQLREQILAMGKTRALTTAKYNPYHGVHGHFAHGPGSATGKVEAHAAASHGKVEESGTPSASAPDHTKPTVNPLGMTHANVKDDPRAVDYVTGNRAYGMGNGIGLEKTPAVYGARTKALADRIMADPAKMKALDLAKGHPTWGEHEIRQELEYRIEDVTTRWAGTSGDTNPASLAMQRAAAEEFGLHKQWSDIEHRVGSAEHIGDSFATPEEGKKALAKAAELHARDGAGTRAILRTMYEETQDRLAAAGIDHVTIYRGVAFDKPLGDPSLPKWTNYGKRNNIPMQPLNSFSSSLRTAAIFANVGPNGPYTTGSGHIIALQVPRERIFSTGHTGVGTLGEQEYVVLGGKTPGRNLAIGQGSRLNADGTLTLVAPGKQAAGPKVTPPLPPKPEPPKVVAPKPVVAPKAPVAPKADAGKRPSEAIKVNEKDMLPSQVNGVRNAIKGIEATFPKLRMKPPIGASQLPPTSIEGKPQSHASGSGTFGNISNYSTYTTSSIRIFPKAKSEGQAEETTAHELGHHIDYHMLGKPDNPSTPKYNLYGSEHHKASPATKALMKTIAESPEMKTLSAHAQLPGAFGSWAKYAVEPREQFARAFSQYVVTRSGSAAGKKIIEKRANEQSGHWSPSSFVPIAKAFDELAKEQGWK